MQQGTCSVDGCGKPNKARGWCAMHWSRWKRNGTPGEADERCARPEDTLDERIARYGWDITEAGCHEWRGQRTSAGYGVLSVAGRKSEYMHRIMYRMHHGEIPDGHSICHSCDNPPCSNPSHLFLGAHVENMRDSVGKRRHAYGERNGHAKLTADQVREIRALCAAGMSQAEAGARYGVTQSCVWGIMSGKSWKLVA